MQSYNTWCMSDQLISRSTMSSSIIHVVACARISILKAEWHSIICVCRIRFVWFICQWHLNRSLLLAVVNNAATTVGIFLTILQGTCGLHFKDQETKAPHKFSSQNVVSGRMQWRANRVSIRCEPQAHSRTPSQAPKCRHLRSPRDSTCHIGRGPEEKSQLWATDCQAARTVLRD